MEIASFPASAFWAGVIAVAFGAVVRWLLIAFIVVHSVRSDDDRRRDQLIEILKLLVRSERFVRAPRRKSSTR